MKKISIILVLFSLTSIYSQDIQELPAYYSPKGVYIFLSDAAISPEHTDPGIAEAVILRAEGETGNFKEIARVKRSQSFDEFKSIAGEQVVGDLKLMNELKTDEEVWNYILTHPFLEAYQFMILNLDFQRAMGTAFLDEEVKNEEIGEKFSYKVRYVFNDNSLNNEDNLAVVTIGAFPEIDRPLVSKVIEQDTLVAVYWTTIKTEKSNNFFGHVYRQIGGTGKFSRMENSVFANRADDSTIVYYWQESNVPPENIFKFYIQPYDLVGNLGPVSDTAVVYSVNFSALPLIEDLSAKDTTEGIFLSWKKMPDKPYFAGIEIQRSREAENNFFSLDTVSINESNFMDTRLFPNVTYHYRLRALNYRNSDEPASAQATASHRNKIIPPETPTGLKAVTENINIKLTWNKNHEYDLFGYYVYRSTSLTDSFVVVSPPLQDTVFIDTSKILSGRTNYVYKLKAFNKSDLESDFSQPIIIRPNRDVFPPAPLGLSGYAELSQIRLTWTDASKFDDSILGYNVYKREVKETKSNKNQKPENIFDTTATISALKYSFAKLTEQPIRITTFTDKNLELGKEYEYAVTSVDAFGKESIFSPTSKFMLQKTDLLPPSQLNVRTTSKGIEINWSKSNGKDITGYIIYKRSRKETKPKKLSTLKAGEISFIDAKTKKGEFNFYSVSSVSGKIESERSPEKGVTR